MVVFAGELRRDGASGKLQRSVQALFPPGVSQEYLEVPSSKAAAPQAQVMYAELQTTEKIP